MASRSDWISLRLDSGKTVTIRLRWIAKVEYGSRDKPGSFGQVVPWTSARVTYAAPGVTPEVLCLEGDEANLLAELLGSVERAA